MQKALHIQAQVLPGKKIELKAPEISVGEIVDVFVIVPDPPKPKRRSVMEIINSLPGQRIFKTPEEADRYLKEERDSWDS